MKTTDHHIALLERLAQQPSLILNATKTAPQAARRLYHRQLEFMAAFYGVTTAQLESVLRTNRRYAY